MSTETKINISGVVGIREAIEQIFTLIIRHLDTFRDNPENLQQIENCHYYTHQLNGMLEMLGLNGISFVTSHLEALLKSLHQQELEPAPAILSTVKQAIRLVYRHLDSLVDGEADNPAKFFPIYQKIMQAQGVEAVSEADLFFPSMREEPPLPPVQYSLDKQARLTAARHARAQFQSGLLGWLKDADNRQNLQQMVDAVRSIEKLPAPHEQRIFWWISSGFLDSLLLSDQRADQSTRRLCGKIEQEIRHIDKEDHQIADQLTRELLYRVARSEPASERIQEIGQIYDWQTLLTSFDHPPQLDEMLQDQDAQAPELDTMRSLLKTINDNWREFSAGKQQHLADLLASTDKLKLHCQKINCQPLEKLIGVLHGAFSYVRIRPQGMNESIALDIASSLLLIENALENFYQLAPGFSDQVDALTIRIRAVITGKEDVADLPELPGPEQAGHHIQEKKLQKQIAQEILISLAQIEDILDRFFFEPQIRNDLPSLPALFKQISGVLDMLGLDDQATRLLSLCRDLAEHLTAPASQIDPDKQTLLANALSSFSFYIEALKNSQPDCQAIVTAAISMFEQDHTGLASPASLPNLSPETENKAIDQELLAIFLEESDDVLATIAENLQLCQTNPTDIAALTTIRRGFHTLKGSGRMVQLRELSEVAWRIEQLLNRWLSEQKHASPALLQLLGDSHQKFSGWCASLRKNGIADIEATSFIEQIKALMYGTDTQPSSPIEATLPTQPAATTLEPEPESEPELELVFEPAPVDMPSVTTLDTGVDESFVMIGDIPVAHDLFAIFSTEARQRVATLKNEMISSPDEPFSPVSHEAMLAAHTLASTSHSLGLNDLSLLAKVTEQWLTRLLETTRLPDHQTQVLMANAVELLDTMVESACQQQAPAENAVHASEALTQQLADRLAVFEQSGTTAEPPFEEPGFEVNDEPSNQLEFVLPTQEPEPELVTAPSLAENGPDVQDHELLDVFLEEAEELLPEIGENLRIWRSQPDHPDQSAACPALLRALHTFKGSARMTGLFQLGELAHQMESTIENQQNQLADSAFYDALESQFDVILEKIEQLRQSFGQALPPEQMPAERQDHETTDEPVRSLDTFAPHTDTSTTDADVPIQRTMLRVDAVLIDRLVSDAGESSIARSQVETQLAEFKQYLLDLGESVDRMREQLREMALLSETRIPAGTPPSTTTSANFDPLELDQFTRFQELTRLMAESMDDVVTIHKSLREIQSSADTAVHQQARLNRQLQQDLVHIRTVPFKYFSERLHHIARQVSRDAGKKTDLTILGNEIEIDRSVTDKIISPLEHLLRNAIVHGIESPAERLSAGKPETGKITLTVCQQGSEIHIALEDDGAGLNKDRIREKALQLGLADQTDDMDEAQLQSLIFKHGLSTLDNVTDIAGRGIGLDVVNNKMAEIGGSIAVTSAPNQGTTFTLRLPITLAVLPALMVKTPRNRYAIPTSIVASVQMLNTEALGAAYNARQIQHEGENFPLVYLAHLLEEADQVPEIGRHNRVLLLQAGQDRLAVHADVLIGQCEVVIKNAGQQLMRVPGVEGATIMGDGDIVLIINPLKLLQRDQTKALLSNTVASPQRVNDAIQPANTTPIVMVVDDSLTVRKVTSRLLERQGYEILIAKDGVGALELLRETVPAVMLVDIEMPHMDGFELIRIVRNNPDLRHIPIIIISSRTADKHRELARELGVNEFMGKPYLEEELIGHIERLIKLSH
ncbi:MAG: Hpt domain-containing protein [Nitrosomonas sp.]|nr:Hpt domain-containing protein [Nitrosomonas sp.]